MMHTQQIPTTVQPASRTVLAGSELLMGIAAVGGGLAMLAGAMDQWLPIAWLAGSPFPDFRVPALALILLIGGANLGAATLLLARRPMGVVASIIAGGFLIGFEVVEVLALGLRMWLQPFCLVVGVVVFTLALRLWLHDRGFGQDIPHMVAAVRTDTIRRRTSTHHALPLRLSSALAVAALSASAAGTLYPGIFRDPAMIVGNAQGTSLVILVVAIPTLIASMTAAARGSLRAVIVWLGALAYILYNAVVFAFATTFNGLFLVDVAMLSLAFWSFVTVLTRVDADGVRTRFAPRLPVRGLAGYLLAIAFLNALAWLAQIIPAIVTNTRPVSLDGTSFLTNPFHVLDLAFSLPLMALGAVWLWRRRPWGFVLSGMYLVMLTIEAVSVATDQVFGHLHDASASLAAVPIFTALALLGSVPLTVYFRNFRREPFSELR